MKSSNLFIYPITKRFDESQANPYTRNVMDSLEPFYKIINKNHPSGIGLLNLYRYFFRTDYLLFNWIEELPDKKAGILQTLFFFFILGLAKLTRKKIIWTVHNKITHSKQNMALKKLIVKVLTSKSDYIITHSKEGINYIQSINSSINSRHIRYIPHPVNEQKRTMAVKEKYDLIIWGNILRYKGIHLFLEYLDKTNLLDRYSLRIVGKISDQEYEKQLFHYRNEHIRIENKFLDEKDLEEEIAQSKIILFTHQRKSVLSSGTLMDSLTYGKPVVGPDTGAFKDLSQEKLIHTYRNFDELIEIIEKLKYNGAVQHREVLNQFMKENSWPNYGRQVHQWIQNNKSKSS